MDEIFLKRGAKSTLWKLLLGANIEETKRPLGGKLMQGYGKLSMWGLSHKNLRSIYYGWVAGVENEIGYIQTNRCVH